MPCCATRECRNDIQVRKLIADPPLHAGPFLMYINADPLTFDWKGSVLFLAKKSAQPPTLRVECLSQSHSQISIVTEQLADVGPYQVYKWIMTIAQSDATMHMQYTIRHGDWQTQNIFLVAGKFESWRWAMVSCNGLSHTSGYEGYAEKYYGICGMWADLTRQHHESKFHVLMGLGDQIYMDCAWEHCNALDKWTRISSRSKREGMEVPPGMKEEVEQWILFFYLQHFGESYFRDALAKIPYMMQAGDHDFVDGFGSYPEPLERCPVMQMYRRVVTKFYLLFQHQCGQIISSSESRAPNDEVKIHILPPTPTNTDDVPVAQEETKELFVPAPIHLKPLSEDSSPLLDPSKKPAGVAPIWANVTTSAHKEPFFGVAGFNFIKTLGQRVRVLGLDTRLERDRKQVICPETYDMIFDRLTRSFEESTVKPDHLIVVAEIPFIASNLRAVEKCFDGFSRLRRTACISAITRPFTCFKNIGFPFAEPVLMTDMIDRWNSSYHLEERNRLIKRLQKWCLATHVRITLLSGDIHMAALGKFATPSDSTDYKRRHYENRMLTPFDAQNDHKLMYQIVTSAIGNVPPPKWLLAMFHLLDKTNYIDDPEMGRTMVRHLPVFTRRTNGHLFGKRTTKFMGLRNWCAGEYFEEDRNMSFNLYVELFLGAGQCMPFNIRIPPLAVAVHCVPHLKESAPVKKEAQKKAEEPAKKEEATAPAAAKAD